MSEFKIELQGIKDAMENFDPKIVRAAARSSINKMANQTKTQASRLIREEYNIPAGRLSKFLMVTSRASGGKLEAIITGTGQGLSLGYFGPRQAGVRASKKAGLRYTRKAIKGQSGTRYGGAVSVEVRRGSRKEVHGEPKPFLAMTKSGHFGIFKRIGKNRLPLQELFGPGVGGLFGSKKLSSRLDKFINDKFGQIFRHELEWRSSKNSD